MADSLSKVGINDMEGLIHFEFGKIPVSLRVVVWTLAKGFPFKLILVL